MGDVRRGNGHRRRLGSEWVSEGEPRSRMRVVVGVAEHEGPALDVASVRQQEGDIAVRGSIGTSEAGGCVQVRCCFSALLLVPVK